MKSAILVCVSLAFFGCAAPRASEPTELSPDLQSLAQELEIVEAALQKVENRLGHLESDLAAASEKNEFTVMVLDAVELPRDRGFGAWMGGDNILLCHPTEWRGYGKMKRFTRCADPVFHLEAEGQPAVEARMLEGGECSDDGSTRYVMLQPLSALEPGVTYRLRPQNDNRRYRWSIEGDLAVTIPGTAR
ncbi:MAG TPA: hypothetical protein VM509_15160 [Planctomycetota bacterium]|nr:hypothetical protein [Planctomycetota bacterium]